MMYFTLLDLLRFFSAIGVLFHHMFTFQYGRLGVYLFFIISGFVIYFSLGKGVKEYVLGRFIRLYPLFWICCTITFLITIFYDNNVPFQKYLIDMLMFNDGKIAQLVDGSYWTLTFELLFYFYIGVFVWIFSAKRLEWFYISWLLIAFFSFYFTIDQLFFIKLLSVRFAPYFIFGGMLALLIDRHKKLSLAMKLFYVEILIFAAVLPIYISDRLRAQAGSISNMTGSFSKDEMIVVELFFILVPILVYGSYFAFARGKLFTKICFILGSITYPLYLLHWKIGSTIITHHSNNYGEITTFSIFIAIALIVFSYILALYDMRLRKFLKKILTRTKHLPNT